MNTKLEYDAVISTHIFILPFRFQGGSQLDTSVWEPMSFEERFLTKKDFESNVTYDDLKEERLLKYYAFNQYFNQTTKDLMYSKFKHYKRKGLENSSIEIHKLFGSSSEESNKLTMDVKKIELLEFYDPKMKEKSYFLKITLNYDKRNNAVVNEQEELLKNINYINESFRRIFHEFLSKNEEGYGCSLNAKEIILKNKEGKVVVKQENTLQENISELIFHKKISNVIQHIIGNDSRIEVFFDDRMYTCCVIADDRMYNFVKDISYKLQENEEIDSEVLQSIHTLYDVENSTSAFNDSYIIDSLKQVLYHRWIGKSYGTAHFVARYAYILVTNSLSSSFMLDAITLPALNFYTDFAIVALLQKIYLQELSERISELSERIFKNKIYDAHLNYYTNYSLGELSVQEQAVDIYNMMLNAFQVKEKREFLHSQMEIANNKNINNFNKWVGIIGLIFAVITVIEVIHHW